MTSFPASPRGALALPSLLASLLSVFAAALLLAVLLALAGCERDAQSAAPPGAGAPPPVLVAPATRRMVEEFEAFSARLAAVEQVEVRARVAGTLERVHFRDGQRVRRGDALFTIDPRPFAAEVRRLEASLAAARSAADLARVQLARADKLLPLSAISRQEADERRAAAANAVASVRAAEAALDAARLNLGFTSIRAPLDGRVSRTAVTAGNLVNVNEPVLTTIVATDRIYAYFEASEAAYLKYAQQARGGAAPAVAMGLFNESGYPHRGRLDFVDNRLDPATGSVQLRAVFDNADGRFTPGLSARMRIGAGQPYEATVVPDRAIAIDQTRRVVLVVGPKGVVEARMVHPGALVGGMRVVDGVRAGEQVVVDGLQHVMPGAPVTPRVVALDEHGAPLAPGAPGAPEAGADLRRASANGNGNGGR